jgi:thioredoxin 1
MDLQKTLSENSVVLVDFYATWCQPCRMMSPIIDAISTEYTGRVEVIKVDVDQHPNLANEFDVTSVPTFLLFKNAEVIHRFNGGMPKAKLEGLIKPLL